LGGRVKRITVLGQPRLKNKIRPYLNKLGKVVHICDPSYTGGIEMKTDLRPACAKTVRPYLKNI
jgi:hypothetical protein